MTVNVEEQKVVEDKPLKTVMGVRVEARKRKFQKVGDVRSKGSCSSLGRYAKVEYDFLDHATAVLSSHFTPLVQFSAPLEQCKNLAEAAPLDYDFSLERRIMGCRPLPSCPDLNVEREMEEALVKLQRAEQEVARLKKRLDIYNAT